MFFGNSFKVFNVMIVDRYEKRSIQIFTFYGTAIYTREVIFIYNRLPHSQVTVFPNMYH